MKKLLAAALLSGLFATNAQAGVIYEQGIQNVATGHNPFTYLLSYDDFTLNSNAVINRITVNAFAIFGGSDNIGNMDWEIRSVLSGVPGNLLFSGNVSTVTKTDTGLNYSNWDLVDYSINVGSVALTAGSYFLGLRANAAQNVHITLINNPVNLSPALMYNAGYSQYWNGKDFAFRLESSQNPAPVSAPLTVALLGLGLAGIGFTRKQKNG